MGDRPRYPCQRCLRILVAYELSDYAAKTFVNNTLEAHYGCSVIGRKISKNMYAGVTQRRVEKVVTSLRGEYLAFRKFLKIPGVSYDSINDEVEVTEEYNSVHLNQETPLHTHFRTAGFPLWDHLHEAFRKRIFPNLRADPPDLYVDPTVYSDSDEE